MTVTDIEPWTFVTLTVDGVPARPAREAISQSGIWSWSWSFTPPVDTGYTLWFFHDCHLGCVERGRVSVGRERQSPTSSGIPTKLGLVLADPDRNWHGRVGWAVEITYATLAEEPYWGVDDLAARVRAHHEKGLNVLIRVDYEQEQSLPPIDDYVALSEYLAYFRRLGTDERLTDVYGYVVGSDYNARDASARAPDRPTTPTWYARVFNGYGEPVTHTDNVVQVLRAKRPEARVIVGPLRPWIDDQDGSHTYTKDVPWLNYMNSLVAALDASIQNKARAGISMVAPDGFDVQAPGQPDIPVVTVQIQSASPPEEVVTAIKDRMVAVQRQEQAQAEAAQRRTLADAEFYAAQKAADADAYKISQMATAEAEKIAKMSETQQEAIRAMLQELSPYDELASQYIQLMIAQELKDNSKWIISGGNAVDFVPRVELPDQP